MYLSSKHCCKMRTFFLEFEQSSPQTFHKSKCSSLGSIVRKAQKANGPKVGVIGLPLDYNSSFIRGASLAPFYIRHALASTTATKETLISLGIDKHLLNELSVFECKFVDLGNLSVQKRSNNKTPNEKIKEATNCLLKQDIVPIFLGGDHSITYPIIQGFSQQYSPQDLYIVHFDRHTDLWNDFKGNRYSHASPFARILEDSLIADLITIGVDLSTLTLHQEQQICKYNVKVFKRDENFMMENCIPQIQLLLHQAKAVYLSVDIDVLDPSYAPGISYREPGGLSLNDLLWCIQSIHKPIIGADIVEFNPTQDINGITQVVSALIFKLLVMKINQQDIRKNSVSIKY